MYDGILLFICSLGIRLEDLERRDERGIRLEAIHIRGVSEMNTKEVFNYFQEFAAGGIEWIDDESCKIILVYREMGGGHYRSKFLVFNCLQEHFIEASK